MNPKAFPVALAALLAALLAAPGASAQQPRPCEPGELGDARTPVTVEGESVGRVENALVVGRRYQAARVIELAIGSYPDSSPYRQSYAKPGSIVVTAPAGVALTESPDRFRGGGYDFTAPRASSLTLTVTWIQELEARSGQSAGECTATAQITRPVFSLQPARVARARFDPGGAERRFVARDSTFRIAVIPAPDPEDPAPVFVVLRVRTGSTAVPSLRSRPVYRRRLGLVRTFRRGGLELDTFGVENGRGTEVVIGANPFIRRGQVARFGFSLEIVQGGRRLGGMRSGATCRIRFSSRAHRHFYGCTPTRFARRP